MRSFIVVVLFLSAIASAQTFRVDLPLHSTLDAKEIHITMLDDHPHGDLLPPRTDLRTARYFRLFHTWDSANDPEIDCVFIPGPVTDTIYADLNNDEDLTNDGPPFVFPHSTNDLVISLPGTSVTLRSKDHSRSNKTLLDHSQKTDLLIRRRLTNEQDPSHRMVDTLGNLDPRFLRLFAPVLDDRSHLGGPGTFLFDYRIGLHSGILRSANNSVRIGVFDFNNNGLFNDSDDVLLVDRNGDSLLSFVYEREQYHFTDIIGVEGKHFRVSSIDPNGRWIVMSTTDQPLVRTYRTGPDPRSLPVLSTGLDSAFWNTPLTTLNGDTITLARYRGTALVLNCWGEWCPPCIEEIPDLRDAFLMYSGDSIHFVSAVNVQDLNNAQQVIASNSMTWTQILLPDDWKERFSIKSYPTNIIIFPDGEHFVRTGTISEPTFFAPFLHPSHEKQ